MRPSEPLTSPLPSSAAPLDDSQSPPERRRWLVFVLPFVVYMLAGSLEPSHDEPGGKLLGLAIPYSAYPLLYTLKLALTLAAMAFALPGYRQFRRPPGMLALLIGAVGIVVWVGLCKVSDDTGARPDLLAKLRATYSRPARLRPLDASLPLRRPGRGPSSASAFWGWSLLCRSSRSSFSAAFSCGW